MRIGRLLNHYATMTKERKIFQPLPSSGICAAYTLLLEEGLVSFPITREAEAKIDTIVANINGQYFGKNLYETPEEKAVAYLYFLINDHPFTDGNKRTAIAVAERFISLNQHTLLITNRGMVNFVLDAVAKKYDILTLAQWFKKHAKRIR